MSGHQEFTPEQLRSIKSAVDCTIALHEDPCTLGTVVADFLRFQDLMIARSGPITSVENSSPIGFFQLPAELRNKIYRYCLVVGNVYPRPKAEEDDRLKDQASFQKADTQIFQLCRQIFDEAAPLYFAENRFILSHDDLPWSHYKWKSESKPVSKVAHRNLRSLSITFDLRNAHLLPSDLLTDRGDYEVESYLRESWNGLADLLRLLELQLLEVSFKSCYCAFCHRRMTATAIDCLSRGIGLSSARVVVRGLINSDEVSAIRKMVHETIPIPNPRYWSPEYDDEDPKDKFKVAFQVTRS
jgi:hypothetical protein